jgi:hypothetical protein
LEGPIYRRNPTTGRIEYLQNGEWSEPTGADAIPAAATRGEATDPLKECGAASNAANALRELYFDILSVYNDEVDPYLNQIEMAGQFSAAVGTMFGPVSASFLALSGFAWEVFTAALAEITQDDWSTDFHEILVCILNKHATVTNSVVSFNFFNVNADLVGFILPVIDAHVRVRWQVWYLLQAIGEQGLNVAGGLTAVSGNCVTCDTWCVTLTPGQWESYGLYLTKGYINSSGHGKESYANGWYEFIAFLVVDTTDCVITRVGYTTGRLGGGANSNYTLWFYPSDTSNYLLATASGGGTETRITNDNPAYASNSGETTVRWTTGANGSDRGMNVYDLKIMGTGVNPFGIGSNC